MATLATKKILTKWLKDLLKKNIIFYTIIAAPLHFHLLKYFQSYLLSKKYHHKSLKKIEFKESIIIVGSGPSLDEISLSEIKNSTVIFLNGSVRKYESFDCFSNNFLWYAQDINAVNRHISIAKRFGIKKVFTIGVWNTRFSFKKYLSAGDVFLLSRVSFCRERDYQRNELRSFYSFRPEFFGFDGNDLMIDSFQKGCLHSLGSVLFSAISFALYYSPKKIILIGFDAPLTLDNYRYAVGTRSPDQISSNCERSFDFNEFILSNYMIKYNRLCESMGVSLYNYSPLTSEEILPKITSDKQLAEILKSK